MKSGGASQPSRQRRNTSLSGHTRLGRTLSPPIMTVPNLRAIPWRRDTLPNMLWICSLIASADEMVGMHLVVSMLDIVDEEVARLRPTDPDVTQQVIDGQLTHFEDIAIDARDAILARLVASGLYDQVISDDFANALAMYPKAPGSWLLIPWHRRGNAIDWESAQRYLTAVLEQSSHGQSRVPTRAKFLVLSRMAKAGKLVFAYDGAEATVDLLSRYPNNLSPEELSKTDATVRAMFLSFAGGMQDDAENSESLEWSREFWRSNWNLYTCTTHEQDYWNSDDRQLVEEMRTQAVTRVGDLAGVFLNAAQRSNPDLYDPDRYEVLTGITLRALRLCEVGVDLPVLWSEEHGSALSRSLVEALITAKWLLARDDHDMYSGFKDYGRGHLKLLKLHLEDYAESMESDDDIHGYIEYLDIQVNQDISEEWQNISTKPTFGGVSVRDMAIAVGMEKEYRLLFAPASSASHGEWCSLDRYVLQRCTNILHGGHRVPRTNPSTLINPRNMESNVDLIAELVDVYVAAFPPSTTFLGGAGV